jgi:hypothetical protein
MRARIATALLLMALLAPAALPAQAQSRVYAKDVVGTFDFVIELDEAQPEGAGERIALRMVEALFAELSVRFTFVEDGTLEIVTSAFGSEPDVDYASWRINDAGQLELVDMDQTSVEMDGDEATVWMWDDGQLRAYNPAPGGGLEAEEVALRPVDLD